MKQIYTKQEQKEALEKVKMFNCLLLETKDKRTKEYKRYLQAKKSWENVANGKHFTEQN